MQPKKAGKARRSIGLVLLCCGLALLAAVSSTTFFAVGRLADGFRKFTEADLSEDFSASLLYDDHVYAHLACGIEILSEDPDKAEQMEEFLDNSLAMFFDRILAVGVMYTMLASAAGALCLYALKALGWIAACALIPAKREKDTPDKETPAEA